MGRVIHRIQGLHGNDMPGRAVAFCLEPVDIPIGPGPPGALDMGDHDELGFTPDKMLDLIIKEVSLYPLLGISFFHRVFNGFAIEGGLSLHRQVRQGKVKEPAHEKAGGGGAFPCIRYGAKQVPQAHGDQGTREA